MKRFAFVSRHVPTTKQFELAEENGIQLEHIGDMDAFYDDFGSLGALGYEGIIVVHPAAALRAKEEGLSVGVFENCNRAPEGTKPQFEAKSLHLWS